MTDRDPRFAQRLTRQQTPEFFWIGCSDSHVPANVIVGPLPGALLVCRNVANLAAPEDTHALAAIRDAVEILKGRDRHRPRRLGAGAAARCSRLDLQHSATGW